MWMKTSMEMGTCTATAAMKDLSALPMMIWSQQQQPCSRSGTHLMRDAWGSHARCILVAALLQLTMIQSWQLCS
jgi:hypothetical protein